MDFTIRKKIYLHIGSPKTGTSSLQYFLLNNSNALTNKGIFYPCHGVNENDISSGNAEQLQRFLRNGDVSRSKCLIDSLLDHPYQKILLSSEYLYQLEKECLFTLRDLLVNVDVNVIVYLRRQDHMQAAVYNQWIKRSGCKTPIQTWYRENNKKERYLYKQVGKWAEVFGNKRIIVRPYEASQFDGGTIFSDFSNILEVDSMEGLKVPQKRINPSYRLDALEAKRLFNILPLSSCSQLLDTFLQSYSEFFGKENDWPYDLLSPVQQLRVIQYYDDCNAAIARGYLGRADGRLFYDSPPDPDQAWEPYPGLSADDIQRIAGFIVERDARTAHQIGLAIRQGLKSNDDDVETAAKTLVSGLDILMSKRAALRDYVSYYCLARCRSGMKHIYYKMPAIVQKPIAAIARKLRIIH